MRQILMKILSETKIDGEINDRSVMLVHDEYNNQYLRYIDDELMAEYYITELQTALADYTYSIDFVINEEMDKKSMGEVA